MAKKKPATKAAAKAAEADRVPQMSVINLKGTEGYRAWLNDMSRKTLIPVASIVRDAVAKWAAEKGFPPPPVEK